MHPPTLRHWMLWLGFAFLASCGCAALEECGDPPDCAKPACADVPSCTPNGQVEICDNGIDDDGDGLVDGQDPACVNAVSPPDGTRCTGQNTTTTAGTELNSLNDPTDCNDVVGSSSGDGDTSEVTITELGSGVVDVSIQITESGDPDPPPTAEVEITTVTNYEPGGDRSLFSVIDLSGQAGAQMTTTCDSLGYSVPIDLRGWVPTLPGLRPTVERVGAASPGAEYGSYTCTTTIFASGDGSSSRTFRFLVGAGNSADGDGDETSNANDRCEHADGTVETGGCPAAGHYVGGWRYFCADPNRCSFNAPAPGVCDDCIVEKGGVVIDGSGSGHIVVESTGEAASCRNCQLRRGGPNWTLACRGQAECFHDGTGAIGADQRGGSYQLRIGSFELWSEDGQLDQLVVDPAALESDDPLLAEVTVETTDQGADLDASFTLESDGQSYERDIETLGGVGRGRINFVFDITAQVTWNSTPGWEFSALECEDIGSINIPTAVLFSSQPCLFTLAQVEAGAFHPLTQVGIEIGNLFPSGFGVDLPRIARASESLAAGGAPADERFAVAGANGVGVYEADNLSLVPSLSTIGGFQLTNVLGSLWLDAPASPNDAHWYYQTPSGTGQTQWFPEIPGFGATQISFSAVRDATYVDGDPNLGRAVYVAAPNRIADLFFEDLGYDWPVLSSSTLLSSPPAGFTPTSAFQTSASGQFLFAARSNPAGTNGRLFRASVGNSPVSLGDLGVDPRLLRCASAVAGTWICVATSFESAVAHVATWNGDATAALVGSFATGTNPLVPAIAASGGEVLVGVPNFGADSVTLARLDGTTGAVLGSTTMPVPVGCTEPSSALLLQGASKLVITCHGTNGLGIIEPLVVP